jgi:hypothetical protein
MSHGAFRFGGVIRGGPLGRTPQGGVDLKHHSRGAAPLGLALALVSLIARPASAQVTPAAGHTPPDDTPSFKVGATIFTDYTYTDEPTTQDADKNTVHPSAFNVGRAYINVTGNLSHLVAFRVTPDITRETGTGSSLNGSLTFRLKYAFGQINFDDFATRGSWARIGVQQTPYFDFIEGIYRYRFQGTLFPEREGFLTSSDFGISTHFNFPGNYGDVHVGVYNGDGYTRVEPNDQKALQARGTLRPFPLGGDLLKGLRLTAFYDADKYLKNGPRNRFIGTVTYEHKYGNGGFDYVDTKDQTTATKAATKANGWSVWVTPKFKPVAESKSGFEGLFRYDNLKPNKSADAHRKRVIAGLAYWFPFLRGPSACLLADMERVTFDRALNSPNQRRYSLHALFNF